MNTPAGWFVNPASDSVALPARQLADQKVQQFLDYQICLEARMRLRNRMSMIITIDRADTPRSIAKQ